MPPLKSRHSRIPGTGTRSLLPRILQTNSVSEVLKILCKGG
jgi:hypothetical protein